jgi:hypothetical protein
MLAFLKDFGSRVRMKRMKSYKSKCWRIYSTTLTDYPSFSADEMKPFKAIMKLEHGFREVVDACASDAGMLTSLINLV